ncbi:retrovirus-related pol polyprotein from transposon TNT 1-94 [Tanacetum coccineum]|uniref:Retrovirus-related pol polyprotein from transposon TNT 1-94 n=1 Tax=Tanacetum coccineum TaxID=301880 RepID=A0ABQ4WFL4_9ASTR
MHDEFEMSMMGELNFFLGLQIKQMEDGIFFNQSKYIKEMLKNFRLEDSKPTKMPMSTEIKLTKVDEADSVDSFKYRGMIGSLLYLTASRPDIMLSVCLCARFQENPKTTHLEAIKRIFRFTFHKRVIDPLDISRNPSKEKGKRVASPLVTSYSYSSSDDNEGPSFLEFYDELSDNMDLTKAQ